MKIFRILNYALVAMLFVFFTGCEKNDTEPEINLQSQYVEQERLMQNGISAYNNIPYQIGVGSQDDESVIERNGEGIFEEEFGTPTQSRVLYKYDNKELYMMPLQKEGVVENFMMVNESDEILIAQKTDVPIEDEDSDAENLGNLFSISAELISNINASSIDNSLGSDYTIFRDGDVLLTEEKIVVAGPQFGTNIFAFRDSYLSKSANIFGQTWGLSVDETLLLDGAFIHCAKSTNPFGSVVIPIGDVTDLECVFLVASEWPDPSAGTTTCEFLAGFATIYNWLGDDDGPITESEIALINEHCFCASEIALNAAKAILMSKNVFPGAISRNNCQDAFRHTFWNALNAQSLAFGLTLAIEFADAHEEGQPMNNNWFMDEHNNTVGQIIGDENPLVFGAAMANLVCEELELGNGIILLQDGVPTVAVPDTNPIDESDSCDCQ